MSALSGKVCIITGASSGIGEATALELGRRGASVVLAARRVDRLESVARQIVKDGGHAVAAACDVANRSDVQKVVDTAMSDFGRVDICINNAGLYPTAASRPRCCMRFVASRCPMEMAAMCFRTMHRPSQMSSAPITLRHSSALRFGRSSAISAVCLITMPM